MELAEARRELLQLRQQHEQQQQQQQFLLPHLGVGVDVQQTQTHRLQQQLLQKDQQLRGLATALDSFRAQSRAAAAALQQQLQQAFARMAEVCSGSL